MKFKMISAAACLLVAASAMAVYQDGINLKWVPKEGRTLKYKLATKSEIPGVGDMEFGAIVTRKIVSVKDDKITVEEKQSDVKVTVGGSDMSSNVPESPTTTYTYNFLGEVLERKLDKPSEMDSARLENAMTFVFPKNALKVGETWTIKKKGDSTKGTFSTESTYKYEGIEEVDGVKTYKITGSVKETDAPTNMTITSTNWLAVEDGELVKSDIVMKSVTFMDGMPPLDATGSMTLIK